MSHPNNTIPYDLVSHETEQHTEIMQEFCITIKHVFQRIIKLNLVA